MAKQTNLRGTHPNSRANLRPGAHRRPEKSPETVPTVTEAVDSQDQSLSRLDPVSMAREAVRNAAPGACDQLCRMANGQRRVDPRVQLAAIRTVLEGAGLLTSQPQQSAAQVEAEQMRAVLAAVGRALELRKRAAEATDAPSAG